MDLMQWVAKTASITQPYKDEWSASVTLGGIDVNEYAPTIQQAYVKLRGRIEQSKFLFQSFANLKQ